MRKWQRAYNYITEEILTCSEGCLNDDGSCICFIYPCAKLDIKTYLEQVCPKENITE